MANPTRLRSTTHKMPCMCEVVTGQYRKGNMVILVTLTMKYMLIY